MAVNRICYKDGKKILIPVLTRKEYFELRDSRYNFEQLEKARRGETYVNKKGETVSCKTRLVQFNYSCYPNEDGTLQGAVRPADTVAMDIDFKAPEQLPEGMTEEKWMQDEILNTCENILNHKKELGLQMLERSATKGLHLVAKRIPDLSQEANLQRISDVLGVPFDEGAKDITRVFFTPTSTDILYITDAMFKRGDGGQGGECSRRKKKTPFPNPFPVRGKGGTLTEGSLHSPCPSTGKGCPKDGKGVEPLNENLIVFDLLVKEAGLDPKALDVFGEHNWHKNLMSVLSLGMAKMMSREQAFAVVENKLPNYSQEVDCATLINYFYDNYNSTKFMSPALREINAKAQYLARQEMSEDDKEMAKLMEGWDAPKLPTNLPPLVGSLVANYDERFREMLCLSCLPVMSALASHFRAQYLNGRVIGPQMYVAVIGGSGSGKGNCTSLYKDMVEDNLAKHDAEEWEKVKANQEERDKKANAKEKPQKYHPKLRLFETASKSSILELQTNLGKNGMLLGQFSEVDGLSNAAKNTYSDISVLLRKGWDMDMHRQFYMSENSCNTFTQMSISLLMCGTVKAMLERLFSENNRESGLMQRCISVLVPTEKRTFRPPRQNYLTAEERAKNSECLNELYKRDLALGDEVQILDLPLTTKAIGDWFDELEVRYNDGLLTDAEADLSHRCGEFIMRTAIPLVAYYGKETKEIVDFARWVGEYAHYTMCRLYGRSVQKNIENAYQLIKQSADGRKTAEPILAQLPEVFTLKDFKDARVKNGQSANVRQLLTHYVKKGMLERISKAKYRKLKK